MREQQTQPGGKHVVVFEQDQPAQEVEKNNYYISNLLFYFS
jgi:hypothetical protein